MSHPPNPTRTHTPGADARAPAADQDSSGVIDRFVGSTLSHYQLEEAVGRGGVKSDGGYGSPALWWWRAPEAFCMRA